MGSPPLRVLAAGDFFISENMHCSFTCEFATGSHIPIAFGPAWAAHFEAHKK